MCGIAGICTLSQSEGERVATSMADAIKHRGPDDKGLWADDGIALSHRRLSIIDIENGKQPMVSASGRYVLVFNGEIFNFQDLRKNELSNYPYKTRSDTEVILAAFEKWGVNAFAKFDGMFAIGIWDRKEKVLTLARDYVGIKPIYTYLSERGFAFASEIKAFKRISGWNPEVDIDGLEVYFVLGFIPAPLTMFKNIKKLRPGHYIEWKFDGSLGDGKETRFIEAPGEIDRAKSEDEWIEELAPLLEESIENQLISDVPISVLLSGGIDSSLIAKIAATKSSDKLSTYNIVFEECPIEREPARVSAAFVGSKHFEETATFKDAMVGMCDVMNSVEEPTANFSMYLYSMICSLVAKDFKVAISGQGADESWAGYDRYIGEHLVGKLGWMIPSNPNRVLMSLFGKNDRLRRGMLSLGERDLLSRFVKIHSVFTESEWKRVFSKKDDNWGRSAKELLGYWSGIAKGMNPFENFLYTDSHTIMSELVLMPNDKLAMAHGLEVRPPLLGKKLLDVIFRIPGDMKMRGVARIQKKYLLRKLGRRYLPRKIANRPKLPFYVPINDWIRDTLNKELRQSLGDTDSGLNRYFNSNELERLLNEHISGKINHQKKLFSLWAFDNWFKVFIS